MSKAKPFKSLVHLSAISANGKSIVSLCDPHGEASTNSPNKAKVDCKVCLQKAKFYGE